MAPRRPLAEQQGPSRRASFSPRGFTGRSCASKKIARSRRRGREVPARSDRSPHGRRGDKERRSRGRSAVARGEHRSIRALGFCRIDDHPTVFRRSRARAALFPQTARTSRRREQATRSPAADSLHGHESRLRNRHRRRGHRNSHRHRAVRRSCRPAIKLAGGSAGGGYFLLPLGRERETKGPSRLGPPAAFFFPPRLAAELPAATTCFVKSSVNWSTVETAPDVSSTPKAWQEIVEELTVSRRNP